jgi:hypothetical protein
MFKKHSKEILKVKRNIKIQKDILKEYFTINRNFYYVTFFQEKRYYRNIQINEGSMYH